MSTFTQWVGSNLSWELTQDKVIPETHYSTQFPVDFLPALNHSRGVRSVEG
jgi:hypothetical protein